MSKLEIKELSLHFGGLIAVNNLSFTIDSTSISSIIGPNGAGKTSIFNMVTGFVKPTKGSIILNGKNIEKKKPYQITRMGLARTFQNLRLFPELSVLDNVKSGMHSHTKQEALGAILQIKAQKLEEKLIEEVAYDCIDFLGIREYAGRVAKDLPYGIQRYVEIARALAAKPKILLLDEPAAGLNHEEKENLINLIKRIRDEYHLSVLIIEHDMSLIKEISEKVIVIDYGKKIAEDSPDRVFDNPQVIEAYLGKEGDPT